jgi:hypothetical protein
MENFILIILLFSTITIIAIICVLLFVCLSKNPIQCRQSVLVKLRATIVSHSDADMRFDEYGRCICVTFLTGKFGIEGIKHLALLHEYYISNTEYVNERTANYTKVYLKPVKRRPVVCLIAIMYIAVLSCVSMYLKFVWNI